MFLLIFGLSSAWALDAPSLNLKKALETARSQNPRVRQMRERLNEVRAQSRVVFATLLPTVNANLTYQQRKDSLNSNAPLFGGEAYTLYQLGFTLNQPILQGTALWDGISVAKRDIELAENDLIEAERDLDVQVARAYYRVLLAEKNVATLESSRLIDKKSVETSEKRQRVGKGKNLEVLQAKTQSALLIPRIGAAKNQLRLAASELATLLRLETSDEIRLSSTDFGQADSGHLKTLLDKKATVEKLPEVRRAGLQIERADALRGVLFSKHLPTLGLFANWGQAAFVKSDLLTPDASTWSLGLQATIPIFSGLSSVNERASLAAQTRQLEEGRAQIVTAQVLARVRTKDSLELAFESLKSAEEALSLARKSVQEAQKDYALGTIDYQSLLVSQQSLLNAELAGDQARFDWIDAQLGYCVSFQVDLDSCLKKSVGLEKSL
ncbi:MAG: TolC family protein [Bdellovibrionales bacterium]|nr:TolC family protein [Bdellovibrionales bacterium]